MNADKIFDVFAHIHASGRKGRVCLHLGDGLTLASPRPGAPVLFLDHEEHGALARLKRDSSDWLMPLRSAPEVFKFGVWDLLKQLRDDPIAALAARGKHLGFCCLCGTPLSNDESVALGMGPICRRRLG